MLQYALVEITTPKHLNGDPTPDGKAVQKCQTDAPTKMDWAKHWKQYYPEATEIRVTATDNLFNATGTESPNVVTYDGHGNPTPATGARAAAFPQSVTRQPHVHGE